MLDAIRIVGAALRALWDDVWTTLAVNLLWLLALVLVIPGPPATLALFYYGNRLAHGEVADVGDFFLAVRRYWWSGWRWGLLNLILAGLLLGDYYFTGLLSQSDAARFLQSLYVAILVVWGFLQLYALPFLFEQQAPHLRTALRNGAVMLGRNLGFSIGLALLLAFSLLVGAALFMLSGAVGGVLVATAGSLAVIDRLSAQRLPS